MSDLQRQGDNEIGTWKVHTLYLCGSIIQVLKEMNNYSLQVLGISEMYWTGQGQFCSENITILYIGKETQYIHKVRILINKEAASQCMVESSKPPHNHCQTTDIISDNFNRAD